ncbi:hypothetical protein [Alicyclobacillus fodiniaquatilis]|uniref:Uncharacterized protein n=1 Tax=Alicyclobacillus fodiniaquatilis TaxID=1661150 RepID=A0ABW4JFM7_9BACL
MTEAAKLYLWVELKKNERLVKENLKRVNVVSAIIHDENNNLFSQGTFAELHFKHPQKTQTLKENKPNHKFMAFRTNQLGL